MARNAAKPRRAVGLVLILLLLPAASRDAKPAQCTDEDVYSQLPAMIVAKRSEVLPLTVYSIDGVRPTNEPDTACTATLSTSVGFKLVRFWPVIRDGKLYLAWTFDRRT